MEGIEKELSAQRQRHHEALEAKNKAMESIEHHDKVIRETATVIMALEFAIKQFSPPDTGKSDEEEPA